MQTLLRTPAGLVSTRAGSFPHRASRLYRVLVLNASAGNAGASSDGALPSEGDNGDSSSSSGSGSSEASASHGLGGRFKAWLRAGKLDKQKLAEYGLGAFAAYGIISNINAVVLMTMAWLTVLKRSGVTPLDGEWAQFLAIYAGLWVGASFMRPIRLSMALAVAPLVNTFLEGTQRRLQVNKGVAFGIMLGIIAVCSLTAFVGALALVGGFPNGLPQMPWQR